MSLEEIGHALLIYWTFFLITVQGCRRFGAIILHIDFKNAFDPSAEINDQR